MIVYRHNDRRYPFLWEDGTQPEARWHGPGEGPVQYFADTPDGAWAEFLRHEDITHAADLAGVSRALWAVDVGEPHPARPDLPDEALRGDSYAACQTEARRLRAAGATSLTARSAALAEGAAGGWRVDEGLRAGPAADGNTLVLFGPRPDVRGWLVVDDGRPPEALLDAVRHR